MAPELYPFFVIAPRGVASLLARELQAMGLEGVEADLAGASFRGTLADAYRVCLWSRLASRVLLELARVDAESSDALHRSVMDFPWEEHLAADGTLAVDATGANAAIGHTLFAAQRVKDGIVDRFRERTGSRPSVDVTRPDLRVSLHLDKNQGILALDLSGESLHRRGYRGEALGAPLKENLAAAILVRAGWPEVARAGGPLVDPLCGSGTLPVEAALMAGDVAPGLLRTWYGFLQWPHHDAAAWDTLLDEARERRRAGLGGLPLILGFDHDTRAVRVARANVAAAGLSGLVTVERRDLADCRPPKGTGPGLLVANPPYGERMGDESGLRGLYEELGTILREHFLGWRAAVFTGSPGLAMRLGIRARRRYNLFNGAIPCSLFTLAVEEPRFMRAGREAGEPYPAPATVAVPLTAVANRLRKNLKTLGSWASGEAITCFRLYDADMPEYAAAVDLYEEADSRRRWAVVQEYEAPPTVDRDAARRRLKELMDAVPGVLGIPPARVVLKIRRRQRDGGQYSALASEGTEITVIEGGRRFLVNLTDRLDTGLYLDHRLIRRLVGREIRARRFLNLFAHTGAATVYAAAAGAKETVSVDLSRTHLELAARNLELNRLAGPAHRFVRADCLEWLSRERGRYGVILLDPPTYSRSKGMEGTLDLQRDHPRLINAAAGILEPGGLLVFSHHARRFKLNEAALAGLETREITEQTVPRDFRKKPHRCWLITRKMGSDTKF